jgi:hypothetical protein
VPVGGVSMYAYPSYRPNRSVPADHGGSSGYRGNGGANSPDIEDRGHCTNSKHFLTRSWASPDESATPGREEFGCCRADSQQQMQRRAALLPGTYSCPQRHPYRRDEAAPEGGSSSPRRIPA